MKSSLKSFNSKVVCSICERQIYENLGEHIKKVHGEDKFKQAVLKAKVGGMPDHKIGTLFNITFRQLEKIITEAYGVNISVLKKPKQIKYWTPRDFEEERTTVWSFRLRGNWATHDARYRGNWSPYIPRNVILKYSELGDVVLDYFVGGGTTAIEAKLLGRKCIARDINPAAVNLTKEHLKFSYTRIFSENYPIYEPEVSVGDARDLSDIQDGSIDLISAHPPYAGIINYSAKVEGDLSELDIQDFLFEMSKVAEQSYRVLKPEAKCAILIGDTRRKKHVVPIGFKTIDVFLNNGFKLHELIIKRQHNCKTTGFWFEKSIKYNFLLLAHEYLAIFWKPLTETNKEERLEIEEKQDLFLETEGIEELETTTVWIFNQNNWYGNTIENLLQRYKAQDYFIINEHKDFETLKKLPKSKDLILVGCYDPATYEKFQTYCDIISERIQDNGYLVLISNDIRQVGGIVFPLEIEIEKYLNRKKGLRIKEIVILSIENDSLNKPKQRQDNLDITHKYLFVYNVEKK